MFNAQEAERCKAEAELHDILAKEAADKEAEGEKV